MEDSGIFLVTSYFFGIPQPTGYPLYTLLAKCFTFLPFGTVAFKIHLLNSILAILACLLVHSIVGSLTGDKKIACISALALGVSASFGHQAIVAEVYMLNACLFLALLVLALKLRENYTRQCLVVFSFVYGLGLSNHFPLLVLASGAFPILLAGRIKEILRDSWLVLCCLFLGLLPYFHLVTAHFHSQFLFLNPINNVSDLWAYLSRQNYAGIDVLKTASIGHSLKFITFFVENLISEFSPLAFPIIILGFIATWFHKPKTIAVGLTLGVLSSSVFLLVFWRAEFTDLTRDFYRFTLLIPLSVCAVYLGFGLTLLRDLAGNVRPGLHFLTLLVGVTVVGWSLVDSFQANNLRQDTFAADYAGLLLNHLPRNSVLLLNDDTDHGPVAYVHFVEKIRPDILVTSQVGVLVPVKPFSSKKHPAFKDRRLPILNFITARFQEGRRVFTTEKLRYFNNETARFPLHYRSLGLYYEVVEETVAKPSIHPGLVEDSLLILDRYEQGVYRKQWSFHRDAVIGKISKLLFEASRHHPALEHHREAVLISAQIENVIRKNYEKADGLFRRVVEQTSGLYLAKQLEIHRQFLVNRTKWINTGTTGPQDKLELMQDAVNITSQMAVQYPFCDNKLAINLLEVSKQTSVNLDKELFRKTFRHCEAFRLLF